MEYMSRILKVARETKGFSFHPRCLRMKLNHLVFADDLMLFCKGDMKSIMILKQRVETFSASSGLCANNSKSRIYLAGIDQEFRNQAAQSLEFTSENLPVRYIGMPLTSKRYTIADYEYLVEEMTNQIRFWYAR
ncbi:uncharacterized protein LOC130810841 [Amaranthus tricolor]|uniref:uncharacterized protein LOC130810841 n=1 Tax=Amaranthus tricolor TaxID=29722 RepID=UPI002587C0A4|nr:uncharacterized protein LOC130810841 [Amaranthus tricolor]